MKGERHKSVDVYPPMAPAPAVQKDGHVPVFVVGSWGEDAPDRRATRRGVSSDEAIARDGIEPLEGGAGFPFACHHGR